MVHLGHAIVNKEIKEGLFFFCGHQGPFHILGDLLGEFLRVEGFLGGGWSSILSSLVLILCRTVPGNVSFFAAFIACLVSGF